MFALSDTKKHLRLELRCLAQHMKLYRSRAPRYFKDGLFSCGVLLKRGLICYVPLPFVERLMTCASSTNSRSSATSFPHSVFIVTITDLRRDNRPELRKAGNLRYAFARTSGEAIAIFDADFCPRSDFLRETVPHLLDSTIGIVQSPQFFRRRREQTWVEQGAGVTQEFFYRLVQVCV